MSKVQVILSREEVTQAIAQFVVAKYAPPGVKVECDVYVFGEHPKQSGGRPHDTMKALLAERWGGAKPEKTPEQQLLTEYGAIVMTTGT